MKFCQPIKPLELFTDEELTDAFCCGGQHQFAIEIFERWNKARAELAKAREAMMSLRSRLDHHMGDTDPSDPSDPDLVAMQKASEALAAKGATNE